MYPKTAKRVHVIRDMYPKTAKRVHVIRDMYPKTAKRVHIVMDMYPKQVEGLQKLQQIPWIDVRVDGHVLRLLSHDDHRAQQS